MIKKGDTVRILNNVLWDGLLGKVTSDPDEDNYVTVKLKYTNAEGDEKSILEYFYIDDLEKVTDESYSELEINNLSLQEDYINNSNYNKSLIEGMKYVKDITTRLRELFRGFTLGKVLRYNDDYKNTFDGYIDCYDMYLDKKTRDENISLALTKLKRLGAKNIKISKNEGRVYFSLDISDIINQYNQDYKQAEAEYEAELNALNIDKYKPNNVILDKLNNYRLKGSRVNVKAASLDKKLTYYYGSKIIGWDNLKADIWQAILDDFNLSYDEREEALEICKAIDKKVSSDNDKIDIRPVDHIRFQSWFKNAYNFLQNNNINYNFKSVQPHSAEIEKDEHNGRCWTIAYELEFPDFNNQKVRFCHHTSESADGGDYGWGFDGYSGNYGKREIENLILNKIKNITNITESYSELNYELKESKRGSDMKLREEEIKSAYHLDDDDIDKFQNIEIPGYTDTWGAIDGLFLNNKTYYLMENDEWGDETCYLVITPDFKEIYETYDDIETCLIDEGILDDHLDESLNESLEKDLAILSNNEDSKDIINKYVYSEDIDGEKIPSYVVLNKIASAEGLTTDDLLQLIYNLKAKYKLFRIDAPNYNRIFVCAPEIKIEDIKEDFADYLLGNSIITDISK